jgi:hypothetical protein
VAEAGDTLVGARLVRLQDGRVTMPLDPKISASVRGFDSGIDPRTLARFPEHKSAECVVRYETEE